jgi:hypothetical protein
MLAAHDSMVFCPALKNRLTALTKSLPTHILNKAITNYGTPEDRLELPKLFVNSKWQSFGAPPKRKQSHAVTLSCVNNKIRLMKELVCLIPKSLIPHTFIHIGLATTNSPDTCWKYLMINNDRQQAMQGITVKRFSPELFQRLSENKEKVVASVAKHFTNHKVVHRGPAYAWDNNKVMEILTGTLSGTMAWTWISSYDTTHNGKGAFQVLRAHYDGPGQIEKRLGYARNILANTSYKSERQYSFESYVTKLSEAFEIMKDNKVEKAEREKVD